MLFLITLSALLFDIAFFFPDQCGWCMLLSPIPLIMSLLLADGATALRIFFIHGLWWGLLVFGAHFTWLAQLVYTHSQASWLLGGVVYGVVVLYFTLTSGLWFWVNGVAWRVGSVLGKGYWWLRQMVVVGSFVCSSWCYWQGLDNWILWPLRLDIGYPFINPCIPLASYPWFLKLVACWSAWWGGWQPMMTPMVLPASLAYVAPVVNRTCNATMPWRRSGQGVGQEIYRALTELGDNHKNPTIFVAPESMFCFPLNHYPHLVTLWTTALPTDGHFLIGSVLKRQNAFYQAVFWLHKRLIIKVYVKKILTPFVEKIPQKWKDITALREAFLEDAVEFSDRGEDTTAEFFDIGSLRIIPRICLEFFFAKAEDFDRYRNNGQKSWIFFFLNDSWFNSFFRKILHNLALLRAQHVGLPVLVIGHYGCYAAKLV